MKGVNFDCFYWNSQQRLISILFHLRMYNTNLLNLFIYCKAFSVAAAIAFFHGAEYLERNKLTEAEFYNAWSSVSALHSQYIVLHFDKLSFWWLGWLITLIVVSIICDDCDGGRKMMTMRRRRILISVLTFLAANLLISKNFNKN